MNTNTSVVISGCRDVEVLGNQLLITLQLIWAKIDEQHAPLQIQTEGGVMGIEDF